MTDTGSKHKFAGIIFDLDGVLVDSWDAWYHLLNLALFHFAAKGPLTKEEFQPLWGQGMEADRDMFFPGLPVETLKKYYEDHFPEVVPRVKWFPGSQDALQALRRSGIRCGVASNSPAGILRTILENGGLIPYFEVILSSEEVLRPKPDPDILLEVLRRMNLSAEQVLFVGDSPYDKAAASAAGIEFAGLGIDGDYRLSKLTDLCFLEGVGTDVRSSLQSLEESSSPEK
ncbi:MAG TPA: HAD family hydrolase [Thermoanaerobaculia bacterium]|nr:HAD family hydrolase [Thermoanaerobaculia bacterium]HUM30552.1 HAD family hydrolase [Thermoanaerobaculia bacterium]HXK68744.1 HAD family hydrolase [Thermoanaerobaculia bacterium]